MGVAERIRDRILQEALDLEPIIEPPAPREDWAQDDDSTPRLDANGELHLRVLSLNAWVLPIAPKCTERAEVIARALGDQWDVVVFQEIWHVRERNILISHGEAAGFHYYHYFNASPGFPLPFGVDSFGTGLLVLSRFPIVSAMYHTYTVSGRPYALHEADYIAGKGVGLLQVQTPAGLIDLYVTHLVSNYNDLGAPGPGDFYYTQRVAQSYEMTRMIATTHRNDMVLLCGDFNSPSDSVPVQIPRDLLQLRDAFTDMNNSDGITFGNKDNKFSNGEYPMRMDYIMYKIQRQSQDKPSWHLVNSGVYKGFYKNEEGEQIPWSDHFGVTAEFVYGVRPVPLKPCEQALGERSKEQLSPLSKTSRMRMCPTTTCIHCDAVLAKSQGTVLDKSGYPSSVRCLQEIHRQVLEGHSQAVSYRSALLRRAGFAAVVIIGMILHHVLKLKLPSALSWIMLAALVPYCLGAYYLAFFFRSSEASAFIELATEVRLNLLYERSKYHDSTPSSTCSA